MKERPILMSAPMVRALLAGTKTQTRRIVKPQQPKPSTSEPYDLELTERDGRITCYTFEQFDARSPYGVPGDRLWVRETWNAIRVDHDGSVDEAQSIPKSRGSWSPVYAATDSQAGDHRDDRGFGWRPGIHMPRWACRLLLEIESVRVERLQDIDELDALAEGVEPLPLERKVYPSKRAATVTEWSHRAAFHMLWESINGAESWRSNPWCWVVGFKRVAEDK